MHHYLSKPDWLEELNTELEKLDLCGLDFDLEWKKVEEDWACGREPEDVAERIQEGQHPNVRPFANSLIKDHEDASAQ